MKINQLINKMKWIVTIAIFAFVIVFSAYWKCFGEISTNAVAWGTFGDYVGGTLNPFLSFLGLIALLLTLHLQIKELEISRIEFTKTADAAQKQVKHFEEESKRTDLYRIIEKLVKRLEKSTEGQTVKTHVAGQNISINQALSHANFSILLSHSNNSEGFKTLIKLIESDLINLKSYIEKYQSITGSTENPILIFYKSEFRNLVEVLWSLKMIDIKYDIYVFYTNGSELETKAALA